MEHPLGIWDTVKRKILKLRFEMGYSPANLSEARVYLQDLAWKGEGETLLCMPWGDLSCASPEVARAQFEEIFIKRQYAFRSRSKSPVIIDCGGNIGMSAIWFRQNYPECQLTVFEADPRIAETLRGNLNRAGYADTIVENAAIWTENGEITFNATGVDSGRIDPDGFEMVKARDVAELIPDEVDLMKIDIEGAEFDVIDRMVDSGAIDRVWNMAVEFHPTRSTFDRMMRIFERLREIGMMISFESYHGGAVGLEATEGAFTAVGRQHMFVQAYIWRDGGVEAESMVHGRPGDSALLQR